MKKYIIPFLCLIALLLILHIIRTNMAVTTVKYFPIDLDANFKEAKTEIQPAQGSFPSLIWTTSSTSSETMYLRQDISLLFENNRFKGIQGKWLHRAETIDQSQTFTPKGQAILQSISFHHGERHREDETITSIQQVTATQCYIIEGDKGFVFIQNKDKADEKAVIKGLETAANVMVKKHNQNLVRHFNINMNNYELYSLFELAAFEHEPLPNFTMEKTKQIIGQLWEGLYKNYILLLNEKENRLFLHHMPIILIGKDQSHLLVLFELHDGKQQLIQQLPR